MSDSNDQKAAKCGIFMHIFAIYGWLSWLHISHELAIGCWAFAGLNAVGILVFEWKKS